MTLISTTPYDVGDVVHLINNWVLADLVTHVDAGAMVLTVKAPDGTLTTPVVNHPAVGVYNADVPVTMAGPYKYRWLGTGANAGMEDGMLTVRVPLVP